MTFIENKKKELENEYFKSYKGLLSDEQMQVSFAHAWGFTEKAMSEAVTDYRLRMEQAMKITAEDIKEWVSTGKTTTEGFISIEEHNRLVDQARQEGILTALNHNL